MTKSIFDMTDEEIARLAEGSDGLPESLMKKEETNVSTNTEQEVENQPEVNADTNAEDNLDQIAENIEKNFSLANKKPETLEARINKQKAVVNTEVENKSAEENKNENKKENEEENKFEIEKNYNF